MKKLKYQSMNLFYIVRKSAQLPSKMKFINNQNNGKIDGHFSEDDICSSGGLWNIMHGFHISMWKI